LTSAQTLLTEHGAALGSLAYVVLQNQADAERVVIDALAEALRRPNLLAQPNERLALLSITARHLLAAARRGGNVDPMLPAGLPSDESDLEAELDRLALMVGMSGLAVRQRVMIALHHVTELSVDEIAAVMRDDRSWAQSELAAARNALLDSMERREAPLLEVTEIIDEP
jgi:DNA-directed RNA polymerase specialized sigma24 family protein